MYSKRGTDEVGDCCELKYMLRSLSLLEARILLQNHMERNSIGPTSSVGEPNMICNLITLICLDQEGGTSPLGGFSSASTQDHTFVFPEFGLFHSCIEIP